MPEDLQVEVSAEDEPHVRATDRPGEVGGIPQPESALDLDVEGDGWMVAGEDGPVGRWLGQDLAQPVELRSADPPVTLARDEGIEGDDPVSGHVAGRRALTLSGAEQVLRLIGTRRVNVPAAQDLGERRALVVVAGAEDRGDAALTREAADEFEGIGVGLAGPVVRDVTSDHDHVDVLHLAAGVQYPA